MNQLPGDSIVGPLGREEQLELLLNKLAGHKSFAFCRGNFYSDPSIVLAKGRSPSETERLWDERSAHIAIMLSMLAKFQRDGLIVACDELRKALMGGYVIEKETIPLEHTTPVTVLMFEPSIVLPLIKWALMHTLEQYKQFALQRHDLVNRDPELGSLYLQLPELEYHLSEWENVTNFSPNNLYNGLMFAFEPVFEGWLKDMESVLPYQAYHFVKLRLHNCGQNQVLAAGHCFGVLLIGEQQDKVLGAIPRDKQDQVATWRFDIPSVLLRKIEGGGGHSDFSFGFHPEDEHARWRNMYPSFVSRGFQHGYGGVMLPRDRSEGDVVSRSYLLPWKGVLPADAKFRILFNLYNHYDDGRH
jgi:hypothetical protein